jgi:hypothetical protein
VVRQLLATVPAEGLEAFLVARADSNHCARDRCVPQAARSQLLSELRNTPLFQLVQQSLQERWPQGAQLAQAGAGPGSAAGAAEQRQRQRSGSFAVQACVSSSCCSTPAPHGAGSHQQPQPQQPGPDPGPGPGHSPAPAAGSGSTSAAAQPAPEPQPGYLPEKASMLLLLRRPAEWGVRWATPELQQRWAQLVDVSGVSIVETEAEYLRQQFAHIDAVVTSGDVDSTCGDCSFKLDCQVQGHQLAAC